jgi:hypothetical protein
MLANAGLGLLRYGWGVPGLRKPKTPTQLNAINTVATVAQPSQAANALPRVTLCQRPTPGRRPRIAAVCLPFSMLLLEADEEHITRVKQGVKAWNAWRVESGQLSPSLAGADLSCATLSFLLSPLKTGSRRVDPHSPRLRVSRSAKRTRFVSGCSGPSTFSWIANARFKSGLAPARSPWA